MQTKVRREVEPRWTTEYVTETYPGYKASFRVPLGPYIAGLAEQMGADKARRVSRPYRPEIDAIVFHTERLILIEAKIFKWMDGVSKLPVYRDLLPSTPEFQDVKHMPVEMQLLVVRPVAWVNAAAEKAGIHVVEWAPAWIVAIFEERDKYWTPEATKARQERKETLKKLGFQ